MSRFNTFGTFLSGRSGRMSYKSGADIVVINAAGGTAPTWKDDHTVIANALLEGVYRVATFDIWNPGAGWTVIDHAGGANGIAGGGGRALWWRAGGGVLGDVNNPERRITLLDGDERGGGALDGTLATTSNPDCRGLWLHRADATILEVRNPDGSVFTGPAYNVQVLDRNTAVWDDRAGHAGSTGIDLGEMLPALRVRVAGNWRVYYTGQWGVVAHPLNRLDQGRVVAGPGVNAFYHEAFERDGRLYVGYSTGPGELPEEAVVVDATSLPITNLRTAQPPKPMPIIGRDCWLGFYVGDPNGPGGWFTDAPKTSCPGNAYLDVITSTYRRKSDGAVIAGFIHGAPINGDVEAGMQSLEQQAAASDPSRPVILYWDARHWPRKPAAPSHAWLCAQANRLKDEPVHLFEADVKSELVRLGEWYQDAFLVLSGQCYTSNAAQTSDLASIPPVVAALTKADVWVTAILVFSGTGRATGLQDHPEVRPNWEELFAGITGEPGGPPMSDGIDPVTGNLVDPEAWFNSKRVGWQPSQYREWLHSLKPDLRKFGIGLQTDGNGGHLPSDLRGRAFLTWEACPNAAPQNAAEDHLQVHQTGPCCGIGDVPCLFVDLVNREATQWTFSVGGGKTMDDYVPLPQTPVPPDPPDGDVGLTIHSFPTHYRRGEIGGLTIVYEAARPNGDFVNLVEMWLDDGAPHQFWANLPPNVNPDDFNSGSWRPGDKDGFYFRTAGFKADRNGEWRLFMRCRTVSKKWSPVVQGAHTVIVTE